jgi:hypothetical protein
MGWGLQVGLTTLGQTGGEVGTATRAVLGGTGAREDAMVITSLPSIQLGQHAVLTLPKTGISD